MLNPFRKLNSLISSAIALPNALHAVVEMAWETNANRLEHESDAAEVRRLRAQVEELNREIEDWTKAFNERTDELGAESRRAAELAFKLQEREAELSQLEACFENDRSRLHEFLAWASPLAQSLPGTTADSVSDVVKRHVEELTAETQELRVRLGAEYERVDELKALVECDCTGCENEPGNVNCDECRRECSDLYKPTEPKEPT
jgi:chromosome segregation ATPase